MVVFDLALKMEHEFSLFLDPRIALITHRIEKQDTTAGTHKTVGVRYTQFPYGFRNLGSPVLSTDSD